MTWAILAVTVFVGAAMRFYKLGTLPLGLYHDEAFNGQDALSILEGDRPIFFEANNGREPLFLYGMALALAILGRTPFAVRVTAAILGTLTIPATFLMGRALFSQRVGLWSAVLIAGAPWPINLSRIGLRAVSMPLMTSLALWLWWSGRVAKGRWRVLYLVLGGAALGISLYTYTAARFVWLALVGFALFQVWVSRQRLDRSEWVYLVLAALLAMMPLIVYGTTHWNTFAGRTAQVSILSPTVNHGDPLGMLIRNLFRAVSLFTFEGDSIPRHNVPLRPLFDPVVSIFFLLGVLLSLVRMRRASGYALALIWTAVMLLPTILAEDCPHFLRAVGVLPIAAVFPAIGLEWASERLTARVQAWTGHLLIGVVLAVSVVWGGYDYFIRHAGDAEELGYYFEADQMREAIAINQFLGTGWQGSGVREPVGELIPGRHVFLGPRLWENRIAVNFLVASPERVSILGRDPRADASQVLVLVWPHGDMGGVREVLPRAAQITVWPGPLERGDLDPQPRLLYVAFRGDTLPEASLALARFEDGIELLGWDVQPTGDDETLLRLRWRTTHPLTTEYKVFVHLEHDGTIIAQDDGTPGGGYYPTTWWSPGDEITDTHILAVPYDPTHHQVIVGWYELGSMQRLRVLERDSQPGADRLQLE